jgi:hypothetical protein
VPTVGWQAARIQSSVQDSAIGCQESCDAKGYEVSQVRVHQLAAELAVGPQEVIEFLASEGRRVRGPSAVLGDSLAAQVRRRFRASTPRPKRPAAVAAQNSSAPTPMQSAASVTSPAHAAPPARAAQAAKPPAPPPRATPASLLNPFMVGSQGPAAHPPAPKPPAPKVQFPSLAPAAAPAPAPAVPEVDQWARRGIDPDEREAWVAAGLRPEEAGLADQCRIAGINPVDLQLRLSGRTAVHRLRGGESATSVWARIQDGEHHPRRGTRLTGRFQLS